VRVLQVATLVSPDGAYGGPVRVALNQCAALQALGHTVELAAGTRGYDVPPTDVDGVPTHLYPVRQVVPGTRFAGLSSRGLRRWFRQHRDAYDVVHVHLARDLVTMPIALSALRAGLPLVVQTHGMVDASDKALARVLDAVATRRVLRRARTALYLTEIERADLLAVAGKAVALTRLTNGVPTAASASTPRTREVLFLARLHPRKRPLEFVKTSIELSREYPSYRFTLVGPDEGEGAAVSELIARSNVSSVSWEGPIAPEHVADRLASCAVYVLPSVDEPYPMTVLEAMSVGTPLVVTDSCGLAPDIERSESGLVADSSNESLTQVTRQLLADPVTRERLGANGAATARHEFSMTAVAERLDRIYANATK